MLPGSIDGKDVTITNVSNRSIFICDWMSALRIDNVNNCKIYCGPVSGSIYIENVHNTLFNLVSQQIRIHSCIGCDFYLHVQSNPTIENCHSLRFAPYSFTYALKEDHQKRCPLITTNCNYWDQVQDFCWLLPNSPNWSILPIDKRIHHNYN